MPMWGQLPKDVSDGLDAARLKARKSLSRRTVRVGGQSFVILRHWDQGFALDGTEAPPLRGLVDLYEGERHLSQALVMQSHDEGGERVFEVKFSTPVTQVAPIVDFVRETDAPVGLLPR